MLYTSLPVINSYCPPNSSLSLKFNPRYINYMFVVKFIEHLDSEQKFSFQDNHRLKAVQSPRSFLAIWHNLL